MKEEENRKKKTGATIAGRQMKMEDSSKSMNKRRKNKKAGGMGRGRRVEKKGLQEKQKENEQLEQLVRRTRQETRKCSRNKREKWRERSWKGTFAVVRAKGKRKQMDGQPATERKVWNEAKRPSLMHVQHVHHLWHKKQRKETTSIRTTKLRQKKGKLQVDQRAAREKRKEKRETERCKQRIKQETHKEERTACLEKRDGRKIEAKNWETAKRKRKNERQEKE